MTHLKYYQLYEMRYEGNDCKFTTGRVEGHPVDTLYLRIERGGQEDVLVLIRPDEASAIAIALMSAVWIGQHEQLPASES